MTLDTSPQVESDASVPEELKQNVLITTVDKLYNWGRKYSTWPMMFGLACCAIEFIATAASRYDLERFGWGLTRASPRQADLMIISGTVTKKMIPNIVRLYNQMPEPKYVMAMGACASGGGPFKEGYNVVSGVDRYLPVDVYIPGCPPTPSALLQGIVVLQERMEKQSIRTVPWYRKDQRNEAIPVPVLGPDIFDPRDIPLIKQEMAERAQAELEPEEPKEDDVPKKKVKRAVKPPKLPAWDVTPLPEAQALADKLNEAIEAEAVVAEKDTLVIAPEHLTAVATHLRDEMGYDLLSNVTGVDYLGRSPRFEVVYHLYSTKHEGPAIVFKARPADDDNPVLASMVPVWRSADRQEREVYDLYGIKFEGHPNLKRILMWEGYRGYPMRKDFKEPYYAEPVKPFTTRWPDGQHERIEFSESVQEKCLLPRWLRPRKLETGG